MKVEKQVLSSSTSLELSLPSGGFDDDFLSAVSGVCREEKSLKKAYLLLKKSGDGNSLFFAFLFDPESGAGVQNNDLVSGLMGKILELFKDEVDVDAVCLNGQDNIAATLASITAPFFNR